MQIENYLSSQWLLALVDYVQYCYYFLICAYVLVDIGFMDSSSYCTKQQTLYVLVRPIIGTQTSQC